MEEWIDGIKYRDGVALEAKPDITEACIKEGTVRIGDNAFEQCMQLSAVHIPEGVQSIGCEAFADCDNLTAVNLPDGLQNVGNKIFFGCRTQSSR